jgi:hypothetical protein
VLDVLTTLDLGKSIELMIVDALVLADPFMHLADKIHNPEEYLHLNDSVLLEIERSQAPVGHGIGYAKIG